jgi:hypothetical protein
MSLITATPPVGSRVRSSTVRPVRRVGAPRLHVVRDEPGPTGGRERPLYRSQLSVRSAPGYPSAPVSGRSRPVRSLSLRARSARPVPARVGSARVPRARVGAARPVAGPPVRLTRRGRLVVRVGSAGLVLLTLLAGVLLLDRTAEAGSTPRSVSVSYRVVLPGETLWKIAGEVAPNVDRRNTVAEIVELNALSTAGVTAGQRIAVPVRKP